MNGVAGYLNYHILFFGVVIPSIVVLESFLFRENIFFFVSVYFGIVVLEDPFWFIFNFYERSLKEILAGPQGHVWWYKSWVKISPRRYVPFSYVSGTLLSLAFLVLSFVR